MVIINIQSKSILDPNDLVDFDKYSIKSISENLRRPGGRVPDTFVFGAKSQICLVVACDLVRYY